MSNKEFLSKTHCFKRHIYKQQYNTYLWPSQWRRFPNRQPCRWDRAWICWHWRTSSASACWGTFLLSVFPYPSAICPAFRCSASQSEAPSSSRASDKISPNPLCPVPSSMLVLWRSCNTPESFLAGGSVYYAPPIMCRMLRQIRFPVRLICFLDNTKFVVLHTTLKQGRSTVQTDTFDSSHLRREMNDIVNTWHWFVGNDCYRRHMNFNLLIF